MKVRSADLEKVRFPDERRGYDAAKVDAVLTEVIATLKEYEAADEALHRTFVEAQRIKDEMLEEAKVEAGAVSAEAEREAAAKRAEAKRMLDEASEQAEKLQAQNEAQAAEARQEIQQQLTAAKERAEAVTAKAQREAEELVTQARSEAERIVAEAQASGKAQEDEARARAAEVVADATRQADAEIGSARREAAEMLREARAEHAELSRRVPQLRTAVADIRQRMIDFAEQAKNETDVMDGLIDLAAEEAISEIVEESGPAPQSEVEVDEPPAAQADDADPVDVVNENGDASSDRGVPASPAVRAPGGEPTEDAEMYGSGLRRRLEERAKQQAASKKR